MKLKDYISEDKPREKIKLLGVNNITDSELLCILLRTGNKKESVNELANRIIKEVGSLKKLSELSYEELIKIDGIKESKASILLSAFEICKRINKKEIKRSLKFNNPKDIYEHYKFDYIGMKQEVFNALFFDNKLNLIKKVDLFKGSLNKVNVEFREIFSLALKLNSTAIVIMHNHPSGDSSPSKEDIELTEKVVQAGRIMNIPVLDHIIISSDNYYSFYDKSEINT